MTAHQKEALAKALQLVGEHFDRSVVIVEWETDDGFNDMVANFQGGKWSAIGLLEGARHLILGN